MAKLEKKKQKEKTAAQTVMVASCGVPLTEPQWQCGFAQKCFGGENLRVYLSFILGKKIEPCHLTVTNSNSARPLKRRKGECGSKGDR